MQERRLKHAATIQDAMRRFGGNRTRVARELGLSRQGLRKKVVRLGLEDGPKR